MTFYGPLSGDPRPAEFGISYRTSTAAGDAPELVGESMSMQRLRLQIERIGPHFRTVLVHGEIGTGKELVARALHGKSGRAGTPMTVCHAARLSGMDKSAERALLTQLRAAQEGTLFLDGVDEVSPEAQKNLLEMLDRRTGLRTIASSSQNLRVMAAAGLFRSDLYHRLAVVEIPLEPLRRRTDDIPVLANYFLGRFASLYQKRIGSVAPEAMQLLMQHEWPGNVRELENVVHNAVLQCESRALEAHDLASMMRGKAIVTAIDEGRHTQAPLRLQEVIDHHVVRVLRECSGNKVKAAEVLGISRSTLYRMLEGCSAEAVAQRHK